VRSLEAKQEEANWFGGCLLPRRAPEHAIKVSVPSPHTWAQTRPRELWQNAVTTVFVLIDLLPRGEVLVCDHARSLDHMSLYSQNLPAYGFRSFGMGSGKSSGISIPNGRKIPTKDLRT
jgi:hypothetical protein